MRKMINLGNKNPRDMVSPCYSWAYTKSSRVFGLLNARLYVPDIELSAAFLFLLIMYSMYSFWAKYIGNVFSICLTSIE